MKVTRVWAMPSIWTFNVIPIKNLLEEKVKDGKGWVDPFAGKSKLAEYRNDIEQNQPYRMDALEFLKTFDNNSVNGVLFDPPYSVEQCLRRYTPKQKGTAGRAEYWARCKDEIVRIVKPNGVVISFCWDSVGMGKSRGFTIEEILLICHGACHNDTIVTIDRKTSIIKHRKRSL